MKDRLLGLLLFLPVPAVLWLFTRAPLGVVASLSIGILLMASHRLYARPFSLSRAPLRCLWCGGPAKDGPRLTIEEPSGPTEWRACRPSHAVRLKAVFSAAHLARWPLRIGILGGLLVLFGTGAATSLAPTLPVRFTDASALFRLAVALVVTPFGWLASLRRPVDTEPVRVPFPLHIQALIGTAFMLWLFRIVGIVWLAATAWYFAHRF